MVLSTICLLFSVFIGTVSHETAVSLRCFSCHDYDTCIEPFSDDCSTDHGICYTLRNPEGKVVGKGCASSCDDVNKNETLSCDSCNQRDHCNGPDQGIGMNVDVEHHRNVNGTIKVTNETVKSKFEPNPNAGGNLIGRPTVMTTVSGELNKSNSTVFWKIFWLIVVVLVLIIGSITFIIYRCFRKPSDKTSSPIEGQSDELLKDQPFAPPSA